MKPNELREQIYIQFDAIEDTLVELKAISNTLLGEQPSRRDIAAAGLFLANFYNGIENVMKRFAQFHKISIPSDDNWHFELMESFCDPPKDGLPLLIDQDLAQDLAPYRHFRHVVHHNYGVGLDWNKMLPGVQQVESVWQKFKRATEDYLTTIPC